MRIMKTLFNEGEASTGFTRDFAKHIYDGEVLYHHLTFEEYFFKTSMSLMCTPRSEYTVLDDDGNVVASMAFYKGYHNEIGRDIIYVMMAYTKEPGLLAPGYRWAYKTAKLLGCPYMSFTQKIEDYKYHDIYWKIK